MGHQDVVPVPLVTESRWKYPPYSAHYDGRYIWGRGGTDCKNVLIGILEAFEILLEKEFVPERTILAGFGFDEEISGPRGAKFIAEYLEKTRGKDSIDLILDEGGLGIKDMDGATFALPGLGEKGERRTNTYLRALLMWIQDISMFVLLSRHQVGTHLCPKTTRPSAYYHESSLLSRIILMSRN